LFQSFVNYISLTCQLCKKKEDKEEAEEEKKDEEEKTDKKNKEEEEKSLSFDNLYKALTFDNCTFTVSDVPGSQHVPHA
jgi:translation elongation factor EF-1alpha